MIKVQFSNSQPYHGVWHKPYEPFLIEEADETKMVSIGASILQRGLYMSISKPVGKTKKGKKK